MSMVKEIRELPKRGDRSFEQEWRRPEVVQQNQGWPDPGGDIAVVQGKPAVRRQ